MLSSTTSATMKAMVAWQRASVIGWCEEALIAAVPFDG